MIITNNGNGEEEEYDQNGYEDGDEQYVEMELNMAAPPQSPLVKNLRINSHHPQHVIADTTAVAQADWQCPRLQLWPQAAAPGLRRDSHLPRPLPLLCTLVG
jgi:hypothetical protein